MSENTKIVRVSIKDKRKAQNEFRRWKKYLKELITIQSRLVFNDDGKSWTFVLPHGLVKLVWITTIKEKLKVEIKKGSKQPLKDALSNFNKEIITIIRATEELNNQLDQINASANK